MVDRNRSARTLQNERFAAAGTIALGLGIILILARALETAFGIPGLPRSWYQNDWLWWLVGLISAGTGARLLMQSEAFDQGQRAWAPTVPGRRFRELTLYTREGCHLCDEARETIEEHRRWLPSVTLIDIDSDSKLIERFGTCVPVLEVDGKVRFRGAVNSTLLRRLIEGSPPNIGELT